MLGLQQCATSYLEEKCGTEIKGKRAETNEQKSVKVPSGVYSIQKLLSVAVHGDGKCRCGV